MPTVARGLFRWLFHSGARLEDFADRLNHVWTFGLLLILGAVISWKQGYGEPIACWCPAEFTHSMVVYTQKTCWHSYYLSYFPRHVAIDRPPLPTSYNQYDIAAVQQEPSELEKETAITTYYQWVPVILCLQALLFKLPNIILYIFHGFAGLDFDKVAGLTAGYQYLNLSERQNLANQMARYIYRWCKMFPRGLPWRMLTLLWFLVKCLYCVNIVIQVAYVDRFLKTTAEPFDNSTSYGDAIYDNIAKNNGSFWKVSPVFPQRVLCDFVIRQLRNIQEYVVQCDLPANRFTEHAYMFLWVWLVFVAVVTTLSLAVWVVLTLLPFSRQRYIKRLMEISEETAQMSNQDVSLLTSIMGEDGVMIMKLVGANSSELLVRDVVCCISRMSRGGAEPTSGQSGQIIQHPPASQPVVEPTASPGSPQGIYPGLSKA